MNTWISINWSEAFARSAREGEGPTIERYGIKQLVSRPLLEKWAVFTLPPSLLACKSYNATREPLPLGRSPVKCPSCRGHSPQPARHDGAGRREAEVEPNHHPGDLPHHHQHHLHRPGAALQLRYLAQSGLFLQSQLTVQNICIYFLPESGEGSWTQWWWFWSQSLEDSVRFCWWWWQRRWITILVMTIWWLIVCLISDSEDSVGGCLGCQSLGHSVHREVQAKMTLIMTVCLQDFHWGGQFLQNHNRWSCEIRFTQNVSLIVVASVWLFSGVMHHMTHVTCHTVTLSHFLDFHNSQPLVMDCL